MKNTFANAGENVSDEQLRHVTGGARVNARPHGAEDHLIDHGDLHATAAADGNRLPPPRDPPEVPHPRLNLPLEEIKFCGLVTVEGGFVDSDGNVIPGIDRIEVLSNHEVWAILDNAGDSESVYLGDDLGKDIIAADNYSQTLIDDAWEEGVRTTISGSILQVSLPNKG